jgi:hypothetical protein
VVEEMVNMIQTQRAYEINSKAITTSDQMLQKLSQLMKTLLVLAAADVGADWPAAPSPRAPIVKETPTSRVRRWPMPRRRRRRDLQRQYLPSDVRRPPRAPDRRPADRSTSSRRPRPTRPAPARATRRAASASACRPAAGQARRGIATERGTKFADGDNQSASQRLHRHHRRDRVRSAANGNLIVAGEKQIAMNKGVEFIRFSGMVSPDTIQNGNTVSSTLVADARVEYRTNSQIDRAEMTSMMSRFFQSLLPF